MQHISPMHMTCNQFKRACEEKQDYRVNCDDILRILTNFTILPSFEVEEGAREL